MTNDQGPRVLDEKYAIIPIDTIGYTINENRRENCGIKLSTRERH